MSDKLDTLRGSENRIIAGLTLGYKLPGGIGDQVFPIVPVDKMTGKFMKFSPDGFVHRETARALRSDANEFDFKATYDTFSLEAHALQSGIDHLEEHEAVFDIRKRLAMILQQSIITDREIDQATIAFADASAATVAPLTGTAQWSDLTDSNPFADVRTAKASVRSAIGIEPNTMIMGMSVWEYLQQNETILERIKFSERGIITEEIIKAAFGVENLLVGKGVYNTTPHATDPTFTDAWGKHVVLAYIDPNPGLDAMTWGMTFRLKNWPKTWTNVKHNTFVDGVAQEDVWEVNVVTTGAAYKIKNAVA